MSQTERALDGAADELDDEFFDEFGSDVDVSGALEDGPVDGDDLEVLDLDDAADLDAGDETDLDQPEGALDSDDDVHGVADDRVDAEIDAVDEIDDEPDELPEIIMATVDDDEEYEPGGDPLIARRLPGEPADDEPAALDPGTVEPDVSDDLLEELRQADIDGPTVALAPQDDTSSAIRRPRRSPEYDPAPFPIPLNVPRMLGRKPRVRRVTRVVRHVDPWSVFKIAIVANLVLYLILLTAGVLLWNVSYATGTVDNVERFFESFGWSSFEFNGGELYHNAWIGGLFLVIGFTGLAVLLATLFNLITDLVGGMRFTVLEEEVVEARTSPMRRFVVRRAEPEVPLVTYDESGPIIREGVIDDSGRPRR